MARQAWSPTPYTVHKFRMRRPYRCRILIYRVPCLIQYPSLCSRYSASTWWCSQACITGTQKNIIYFLCWFFSCWSYPMDCVCGGRNSTCSEIRSITTFATLPGSPLRWRYFSGCNKNESDKPIQAFSGGLPSKSADIIPTHSAAVPY